MFRHQESDLPQESATFGAPPLIDMLPPLGQPQINPVTLDAERALFLHHPISHRNFDDSNVFANVRLLTQQRMTADKNSYEYK